MNDPHETFLLVDRMIDEVAAGRSGSRSSNATRTADEALVAELSGLTVIDWPPDEAGDRIACDVALGISQPQTHGRAGWHRFRRRPAHSRRWLAVGLAAAAALAVVVVQLVPSHQGSRASTRR